MKKFLKKYPLLGCVLLLITCLTCQAQYFPFRIADAQIPDSIRAINAYREARKLFEDKNLPEAYDRATEALQYAMQLKQENAELDILSLLADIALGEDQAGDAIPYTLRIANILEGRNDTMGIRNVYIRLAQLYKQENVDKKAGEYYRKALDITPPQNNSERYDLIRELGMVSMNQKEYDSAAVYFNQLVELCQPSEKSDIEAYILLAQANTYKGNYRKALEVNLQLFKKYEPSNDYSSLSTVKNNIAFDHTMLKEYDLATAAYQEAIMYGEKAGFTDKNMALLKSNTAVSYQNKGDKQEALKYFKQSINHLETAGMKDEKSRVENMVALVYYHQGDLYNAGLFSRQSIESAIKANSASRLQDGYLTYSRILREGNDPIQALEYYEKYLGIRDSLQRKTSMEEEKAANRMFDLEKSEKDLKLRLKEEQVKELAIKQLTLQVAKEEQEKELLKREKDLEQLEKERLKQSLEITRQRHETERKEKENQILEQESRIKDLKLEQEKRKQKEQEQEIAMLEQQKQINALELERQKASKKAMIWIIFLVVLVSLVILASLLSSRRKNLLLRKQKKEIQEKNTDLEQKNEEIMTQRDEIEAQRDLLQDQKAHIEEIHSEITQSIQYAKRIQSSTLPEAIAFHKVFADHFILFKPRDIVSGDFYWIARVENVSVVTVVDCTGHGVPGAFMSMLGMSLLKEIVVKEYITHPGVILRRMRKEVIQALGQKGISGEQRDGMDMSVITLNHETNILNYAGAFNNLYVVRNLDLPAPEIKELQVVRIDESPLVLYEVQADHMPIGLYPKMEKFTTHEFPVFEKDRLYLFTDGFADQFGGDAGKKFMYKNFKQLLLTHSVESMLKMKMILMETLENWMGTYEQVDDICVLGFKINKPGLPKDSNNMTDEEE
jgi:serine phosphatase RsbU (regulator of sigma subunit)